MDFSEALQNLKDGLYCRRKGWNGKDAYVYMMELEGCEPCLAMFTQEGKYLVGWLASQLDIFGDDWEVI